MKKILLSTLGLLFFAAINTGYAATATIVNNTACTCTDPFDAKRKCSINQKKAVPIQALNKGLENYGNPISPGGRGPAPIFVLGRTNNIMVSRDGITATYASTTAIEKKTFYVVTYSRSANVDIPWIEKTSACR